MPLWPSTAAEIRAWLAERNIDPRSSASVFVNLSGGVLTRWGVRHILRKHARAATASCPTIAEKRIHPHVIRHTTAAHILQAGVDASAIRDILGHQSAETTWRYTRVNLETKCKAVESCAPIGADAKPPVPVWRRDPDILDELEALGRRRGYVEPPVTMDEQLRAPADVGAT